jgi:hypothetical protein
MARSDNGLSASIAPERMLTGHRDIANEQTPRMPARQGLSLPVPGQFTALHGAPKPIIFNHRGYKPFTRLARLSHQIAAVLIFPIGEELDDSLFD